MQCISPLNAGYDQNYKLTFQEKSWNKAIEPFKLPCGKCLPCRLNTAREKSVRAYHESKMHPDSIFLTLTYSEENLLSPTLNYSHFQLFMKKLRDLEDYKKISYMVTGEYGEKNKRPHWHALLFNYRPADQVYKYTSHSGDKVYTSKIIDKLWKNGNSEFGTITLDSASYVARYAAKKLVHGNDQDHSYHPIHKTSSKHAIGRSWIEKYYQHTFQNGFVVLKGQKFKIPRYYVDWAKKHQPDLWKYYVTQIQPKIIDDAVANQRKEELEFFKTLCENNHDWKTKSRPSVKHTILKQKFKRLQENLKL